MLYVYGHSNLGRMDDKTPEKRALVDKLIRERKPEVYPTPPENTINIFQIRTPARKKAQGFHS